MKLLFVSYSPIPMDVTMPEREPLGGSESCAAYLARQLAKNGHAVTFAARLPPATPEFVKGVRHVPLEALHDAAFFTSSEFDATIALSALPATAYLKQAAPKALNIAWLHLLPDQTAMAPLAEMTPHIDCVVFVSNTQKEMVPFSGRSHVIGNGIAPAFQDMFTSAEELRAAKQNRAAYTSMPYRGLHLLAEVIPRMRGGTQFDIFSAMQTYRAPDDQFAHLYQRLKNTPRTTYHGSVSQPVLAQQLRSAAFLSYPCAFVETYCIAALEAIAAGLKVVSLELGALPETTLGFADLLPLNMDMTDPEIVTDYIALLEKNVMDFQVEPREWAEERFEQSRSVNRLCSWQARAAEWEAILASSIAASN